MKKIFKFMCMVLVSSFLSSVGCSSAPALRTAPDNVNLDESQGNRSM